jgi:hypothetical protein
MQQVSDRIAASRAARNVPQPRANSKLPAAVALAILCTAFSALYWNRFLAASAGSTFFYLAEQILQGRLPYRDIFFVVTPLSAFKVAALIHFFGDYLVVARFEGALERTILGLLLFFLLTRFCRAGSAMLASFFTIVILASDEADAIVNYHIDSAFWAVAAACCASFCIGGKSSRLGALFAGFFAALSLLTKQTTGAGVIAALALTGSLLVWRSGGIRALLRFLVPLFLGWLIPMTAFLWWLIQTRSLTAFLHTFLTTSTSKGSLLAVLARPAIQLPWLFLAAAAAAPLLAWVIRKTPRSNRPESLVNVAALAAAGVATIAMAAVSVYTGHWWPGSASSLPSPMLVAITNLTIMAAVTGSAFLFFDYGWRFFKGTITEREQQIWLLSAVSFAVAYMLSLSWAVYSPMAAPGVALIAGLALDRWEGSGGKRFWALAAMLLLFACSSISGKLTWPFQWMYWAEPPVDQARFTSTLPKLAGLRISEPTLSLTEKIAHLIQEHTKPGDSLLVYPYFPVFYVVTGLNPPTYTFNHYLDVCPDQVCAEDAATLRAHPPDAIVYLVENEEDLAKDELVFRSGRKSGSREVARAIEDLAAGYQKLLSSPVPGSSRVIEVYTRH